MTANPLRILVTGFGAFPGTRHNPTAQLVRALEKNRPRLARLGITLELAILPVAYAEIGPRLDSLALSYRPDGILHFGVAARRKHISIETRAVNRASLLRPDASGTRAEKLQIVPDAPFTLRSTFPAVEIDTALARAGIDSRLSIDAGRYVCNATLYLSLAQRRAQQVGFIHVPRVMPQHQRGTDARRRLPTLDDLARASVIAILAMARALRRNRSAAPVTPSRMPDDRSLDRVRPLA